MTRLLLIRHGETTWTEENKLQGQADPPLSALGRAQAGRLAPVVNAYRPEMTVSSDLTRAKETAATLGLNNIRLESGWREADLGAWTGHLVSQLQVECAGDYRAWRDGVLTPPAGESWDALCKRIGQNLSALRATDKTIVVVTHGGPIRAACSLLLGLDPPKIVPVEPASVTVIDINGSARLRAYNITAEHRGD